MEGVQLVQSMETRQPRRDFCGESSIHRVPYYNKKKKGRDWTDKARSRPDQAPQRSSWQSAKAREGHINGPARSSRRSRQSNPEKATSTSRLGGAADRLPRPRQGHINLGPATWLRCSSRSRPSIGSI